VCGCARGDICRVVIGYLLFCGLYKAALFMLMFMFDTAFVDSWQRCPGLYSPSLALPCAALCCLLSPGSRTLSFWKQLKGPPSTIAGHCIRHPQRLVGRGSLKAISTCCRRTLSTPQLPNSVTALRHNRLSPIPAAGTTPLCDNPINSISLEGSWEGPSQFTTARYFRDRNLLGGASVVD
jgi:hypothetical protein